MAIGIQGCQNLTCFSGVLWGTTLASSSLGQEAKRLPEQRDRVVEMGRQLGQPQFWASDTSHGGKRTGCWPTSGDLDAGPVRQSRIRPTLGWLGRAMETATGWGQTRAGRITTVTWLGSYLRWSCKQFPLSGVWPSRRVSDFHYSFLQGQQPRVLLRSWLSDPLATGDLLRAWEDPGQEGHWGLTHTCLSSHRNLTRVRNFVGDIAN